MAGILQENEAAKPIVLPTGVELSEAIKCGAPGCAVTYTLAYGKTENRIVGNRNNIEMMREAAHTLIEENHPHASGPADGFYRWGGPDRGWLDKKED